MTTLESIARTSLTSRRRAIQRLFQRNSQEEKRLQEERPADWPDRAVAYETTALLGRLSENERRELAEIDAALRRIEQGMYGRCERCEGPIGRQRLRAIPEARHCMSCELGS